MKSVRGIYYDLNESDYYMIFKSNNKEVKFYFSSLFNRRRFIEKSNSYLKNENLKLDTFYNVNINATLLLLISLYKKIEKRGFRVLIDNKEIDTNYELTIV